MNLNRIVILIAKDNRRGKLNGRSWKILLNRLGIGNLYRRPKDINLFKAFLENRQYTWGEEAETAVKFFFGIQGIRRVDDGKGGRLLRADLARRVSSQSGQRVIGEVTLNLKTNQIAYDINQDVGEEEGPDYVELMSRAIEDFERERVVRISEIIAVAEAVLRNIGFSNGPVWFVRSDGEELGIVRELTERAYEWGYDFSVDEIDLGDLKKTSKKLSEVEDRAYDYVWNDIRYRANKGKAVPVVLYRGVNFVVDKLAAEGKILVKDKKVILKAGVADGK